MRALIQICVVLLILALGVGAMVGLSSMKDDPEVVEPKVVLPLVEVLVAEPESLQLSVSTQGTVTPAVESRLVAEVAGTATWVSPSLVNGGFIRAGETLVTIDATDYGLAVEEAKLAVAQAELRVQMELADGELAREEWESLGQGREASPLTLREPQLAEARAQLQAARARLARAERDVERCAVRAPYDGRVRSEAVDRGQFLARGTELARIYSIETAEVRLPLADDELSFLELPLARGAVDTGEGSHAEGTNGGSHAGPRVRLAIEFAGGQHRWEGRLVRTEAELDPKSRMVVVVASVDDPYGHPETPGRPPLTVGMFVDAEIEGRRVQEAYDLPRSALRRDGRVFVVEEGRLAFREVEVLQRKEQRVLIAGGLEPGDAVIVSPLEAAVEGMGVEVAASTGDAR